MSMTFSTPHLSEATREMMRRANRWGGIWVVVLHPHNVGEYGVGMQNVVPGAPIKSYDGGNLGQALSPNFTPSVTDHTSKDI